MPTSAAVIPQASGLIRGDWRAADRPQPPQPLEEVDEEGDEERRPDDAGLDERRDVERVRAEVRPAGHELVVDGEVVQAEPKERVRREHVRDEAVDVEVVDVPFADVSTRERSTCWKNCQRAARTIPSTTATAPSGSRNSGVASRCRYGPRARRGRRRGRAGRSARASPARRGAGRRARAPAAASAGGPARAAGRAASVSSGITSSIPRWFGSPVSAFGRKTLAPSIAP